MALVKKDLFFEKASRRMILLYLALPSLGLLISSFDSRTGRPAVGIAGDFSASSQLFLMFSLMTTVLVPVIGFMFMVQNEKTYGSFAIYRTLPVSCNTLFWSRVLSSWVLTVVCISMCYLFYLTFLAFGLVGRDALTSTLLGPSYILFLISLSIFTSVCGIGLSFNVSPQLLPTVVTAISALLVVLPFIFSQRMIGFDAQDAIAAYFVRYGLFGGISLALLLLSLLIGVLASWVFKLKRSYV